MGSAEKGFPPLAPPGLVQLEDSLIRVERLIALLESFWPSNFASESAALRGDLERGCYRLPRFVYRPLDPQNLSEAHRLMEAALISLSAGARDPEWQLLCRLYEERVAELKLDVAMLEQRAQPQIVALSARRFLYSENELVSSTALAKRWRQRCRAPRGPEELVCLRRYLDAKCREGDFSFRVVERRMASVAAVSADALLVRSGAQVSRREAARIWTHEVLGHLLPRIHAGPSMPLSRLGTAESDQDEEGRATWLENEAGLLSSERKAQLAIRFQLAAALRQSKGHALEKARSLVLEGESTEEVGATLARVCRGGGLAREICYIPSFLRVKQAVSRDPRVDRVMARGRVSVRCAELYLAQGELETRST